MQEMINRAKELLSDGTVNRVLGWAPWRYVLQPGAVLL